MNVWNTSAAVDLRDALLEIVIAPVEHAGDFLVVLPASLSRSQSFLTRLRHSSRISASVFGQGFLLARELVALVLLEIEAFLEQRARVRKALDHALLVEIENGERNASGLRRRMASSSRVR